VSYEQDEGGDRRQEDTEYGLPTTDYELGPHALKRPREGASTIDLWRESGFGADDPPAKTGILDWGVGEAEFAAVVP